MTRPIPIVTLPLFEPLDNALLSVLKSLAPADWHRATRAGSWHVKDVAAHLLDGNMRTLSLARDGYRGDPPGDIQQYADLVVYLNRLNADWVKAMQRVSPRVLIDLMEQTLPACRQHFTQLDPWAPAIFPVSWAGQETSYNWFHIAREYTEKWHHQQQIREAVSQPGMTDYTMYHPVLDTFVQAWPWHYRHINADEGTVIQLTITGDAGGDWHLTRVGTQWQLHTGHAKLALAIIQLSDDNAWKLFTKGLSREDACCHLYTTGDDTLTRPFADILGVIA